MPADQSAGKVGTDVAAFRDENGERERNGPQRRIVVRAAELKLDQITGEQTQVRHYEHRQRQPDHDAAGRLESRHFDEEGKEDERRKDVKRPIQTRRHVVAGDVRVPECDPTIDH